MEHLIVTGKNLEPAIEKAASVLRAGGLVVYPTDTLYGLGCDALNGEALKKVFAVKKRPEDKPLSIAVSSLEMMRRYTQVTPEAEALAKRFLPGALTLVLRKKDLPDILTAGEKNVAIRIPGNKLALRLIGTLGHPISATSANLSGMEPPVTAEEAMRQIQVDLVLDSGRLEARIPSTIVDLSGRPKLLREGKIKWSEIEKVLEELKGAHSG